MKISGHKSLKDFYRYIKISPEQAGQRIREIWQSRGEINHKANAKDVDIRHFTWFVFWDYMLKYAWFKFFNIF